MRSSSPPSRRRFLGALSAAGALGIAGCNRGTEAVLERTPTADCTPPRSPAVTEPTGTIGGWPMIQGGPTHTGRGPPGPDRPTVKWQVQTCRGVAAPPAVVDGRVFVASNDSNLYAFDAETGETLWIDTESEYGASSPAVADGHVFVGRHQSVSAHDVATGDRIWEGRADAAGGTITVGDGLVGLAGRKLAVLDADTGDERWSTGVGMNSSTPAIAGDTLYIAAGESLTAYGLDGTGRWTADLGGRVHETIPAVVDDTVYVGVRGGIIAVGTDGTEQWRYWPTPEDPPWMTKPLAVDGGSVYALHRNLSERERPMDSNIACIALDRDTGREQWRSPFETLTYSDGGGPGVDFAPPVVDSDTVYFGLYGQVIALDAHTGSERWRFDPPAPDAGRRGYWRLSPLALGNDTLYAGNWNGTVYALGREPS